MVTTVEHVFVCLRLNRRNDQKGKNRGLFRRGSHRGPSKRRPFSESSLRVKLQLHAWASIGREEGCYAEWPIASILLVRESTEAKG